MNKPDECHYCERVLWGSPIYLGAGKYRHESCRPGSVEWALWYSTQPVYAKSSAGDLLYDNRLVVKEVEVETISQGGL